MNKTINIGQRKNLYRLGIGTFGIGGYFEKFDNYDMADEISQIRYMFDSGCNAIDCWDLQAKGNLLTVIKEAIKGYKREKLFIVAKLDVKYFETKEDVKKKVKEYLEKLGIEYVDLLQIHEPTFRKVSEDEVVTEMTSVLKEGYAKQLGVCNASGDQLESLVKTAGVGVFESNEFPYNLVDRTFEKNGGIEKSRKFGMKIIIAKPLAQGMISYLWSVDKEIFNLCQKYKATPAQLAIAWLLKEDDIFLWTKSLNRSHISENMKSFEISLSEEDVNFLNEWKIKGF